MTCLYLIANCLSYDHLTTSCQHYIKAFSVAVEPTSFKDTSKHPQWIDAMEAEIDALEQNHT